MKATPRLGLIQSAANKTSPAELATAESKLSLRPVAVNQVLLHTVSNYRQVATRVDIWPKIFP